VVTRNVYAAVSVVCFALAIPSPAAAHGPPDFVHVCPGPAGPATARCHAITRPDARSGPTGLSPAQVKQAYGFSTSSTAGAGKTVAVVAAYNNPSAESDLSVFSQQFGLPACTMANACFKKVAQNGSTTQLPRSDAGWALEMSLDVQWVHAIAPGAKILLVEATSNSFGNLLAAEDYAKAHANYVTNSWGAAEFAGEASYDGHFAQSGVSFFVSSGDSGTPAEYPSSSPNVISVGGTRLSNIGSPAFSETGWSGSGGGCSAYESAHPAQNTGSVSCGGSRATPDVALDADPTSGVSVYDSTRYQGQAGWFTVGGTSASAPMWAGRAAASGGVVDAALVYGSSITFRDITAGNNGESALPGFDLVTGRGSWTGATP
jgi:subtilase family serine protease